MDDELRARVEEEAERAALLNAVKHDSKARVGPLMGPLMGENPEFREYGDQIPGVIGPVVERVNSMDATERRERLEDLAPEELAAIEAEDEGEDHPLPDLPDVSDYDEIKMRVAPNPNGPWHIGHARMPAVIGTYAERYDGSFICRFDDTDPDVKRPDLDAYDQILDAIGYLGFEPESVYRASDRVETYYEKARDLIDLGGAYTCSCSGEEFSSLKNQGEACPHREKAESTVREEFEAMIEGEYASGEMVLRVRTDIEHKNPALRDWVAFRMVDRPHPREEASEYRCWPMLDFQSGVDDHLLGITHIIRGIDLQDSAKRQGFVYEYFDWEYPEVMHWGHVQIDAYDIRLSTSTITEKIAAGDLDGWDDPRAPTLASLERRGIRGQAIVDAMVELGTSTSNVDLAMSSIYAANRDLIDEETDRAFFVRDGVDTGGVVERQVIGGPDVGEPPVHPNHGDRGTREIPVTGGVAIEGDDLPGHGERVWLKGYGCVRHTRDAFEYVGDDIAAVREEGVEVVHWVPAGGPALRLRLRTMDGDVEGIAEPGILKYAPDSMVQFERVGFARIDRHDDGESVAYYAHS